MCVCAGGITTALRRTDETRRALPAQHARRAMGGELEERRPPRRGKLVRFLARAVEGPVTRVSSSSRDGLGRYNLGFRHLSLSPSQRNKAAANPNDMLRAYMNRRPVPSGVPGFRPTPFRFFDPCSHSPCWVGGNAGGERGAAQLGNSEKRG
ncbi:hypothetical protein GGTG_01989 [Gaeumannomyces tritici R3-111a-1]|uniref:Uncharacterized protein n=1 Tax=Gaeumannomyces tritici (strain R3-111a-1) TaxID=644352 RepID=J3NL48_GAET3|nr:hypothetical protein GGTG_01989 [Gaeumannomyces tritici R3-111a-1]EJT82015.1 hypothetical protein GGTG_01989 [Gaeumannomyces tritici R3-111a-1]